MAYLFPQSVNIHYFAAAPLVLTPFVRNQSEPARDQARQAASLEDGFDIPL